MRTRYRQALTTFSLNERGVWSVWIACALAVRALRGLPARAAATRNPLARHSC